MKRIVLALLVMFVGGLGLFTVNSAAYRARLELRSQQAGWQIQTQHWAVVESQYTTLTRQVAEAKRELRERQAGRFTGESPLAALVRWHQPERLTLEQQEQLREELGLNWHASDQWLLVSKATLRSVGLSALAGSQLTDAACGVLAITPDERQRVDAALARVRDQFSAWAAANLQRESASGETVARYTIPADPEFAAGLTNELFATMNTTLGAERAELLSHYSSGWLQIETGYLGAVTNTLTVLHQARDGGEPKLYYILTRQGAGNYGNMQEGPGVIIPKYFPPAFRKVFPGGWAEVAQREGFELPKE